jgi:hypothetical protein
MVMKGYTFKLTIVDEETKQEIASELLKAKLDGSIREELKSYFDLNIEDQLSSMVVDVLKESITEELVEKLLKKLKEKN